MKGPYGRRQDCNPQGFGSTSWWKRGEVDSGLETISVASPHVVVPPGAGRQDLEDTIVGTFHEVPKSSVELAVRGRGDLAEKPAALVVGRDGGSRQITLAGHNGR